MTIKGLELFRYSLLLELETAPKRLDYTTPHLSTGRVVLLGSAIVAEREADALSEQILDDRPSPNPAREFIEAAQVMQKEAHKLHAVKVEVGDVLIFDLVDAARVPLPEADNFLIVELSNVVARVAEPDNPTA